MTKAFKRLFSLSFITLLALPMMFSTLTPVKAEVNDSILWGGNQKEAMNNIGLSDKDPREIVAGLIKIVLGLLGTIAVIIIIMGGFKWMTAGGNEDKVGEAKKLLGAGVIGLIIILAAWGIATFAISSLITATSNE